MNSPTSVVLPAADVDRLREIAGRLLRQSPQYQAAVPAVGDMREPTARSGN